jgi:hypothetical protein
MQPEDVKRIVLHWHSLLLDHQRSNIEMIKSYLIVIAACRPLLSTEAFAAAVATVQAAANFADALGDRILQSSEELQRQ